MLFGVIGWVGAGLSRLFVGDKIPREPAPTNFGYCDRRFINNTFLLSNLILILLEL